MPGHRERHDRRAGPEGDEAQPVRNGPIRPAGPLTVPSGIWAKTAPLRDDGPRRRDVLLDRRSPPRQTGSSPPSRWIRRSRQRVVNVDGALPRNQARGSAGRACITRNGSIQPAVGRADEEIAAARAGAPGPEVSIRKRNRTKSTNRANRRSEPVQDRRPRLGRPAEPGETLDRAAAAARRGPRARAAPGGGRRRRRAPVRRVGIGRVGDRVGRRESASRRSSSGSVAVRRVVRSRSASASSASSSSSTSSVSSPASASSSSTSTQLVVVDLEASPSSRARRLTPAVAPAAPGPWRIASAERASRRRSGPTRPARSGCRRTSSCRCAGSRGAKRTIRVPDRGRSGAGRRGAAGAPHRRAIQSSVEAPTIPVIDSYRNSGWKWVVASG